MNRYRIHWSFSFSGGGYTEWDADSEAAAVAMQREEFEANAPEFLNSVTSEDLDIDSIEVVSLEEM